MNKAFERALDTLNKEQRAAVESIDGPVMVVAGPGTGKTQIIALRIAYILHTTDTPPHAILALTFTESGVTAIRKRLVEYMGSVGYDVHVHTFHSFANSLIQLYPDEFPKIIGGGHIDDIQRIEALRDILVHSSFRELKPANNVDYYISKISGALKELKREGYSCEDFEHLIKKQAEELAAIEDLYHEKGKYEGQMKGKYKMIKRRINKNWDLLDIYRQYETYLQDQKLYDYEDMILEVITTIETDNEFLLSLQESYLYILADEHQDANESQNRLLFHLSSFYEDPNLFVVGDDKQAIYRFQGASLKNFLSFTQRFDNITSIELKTNYRSTQTILDYSFQLIEHNPTLSKESLRASQTEEGMFALTSYRTTENEAAAIAEQVVELISDTSPEEIAILVRRNKDVDFFQRALSRRGISVSFKEPFEDNIFATSILSFLEAVAHPTDEPKMSQALFAPFLNVSSVDIISALEKAHKNNTTLIDLAKDPDTSVGFELKKIADLHTVAQNKPVLGALETIFHEAGMVAYALQQSERSYLETLDVIFGLARSYAESFSAQLNLEQFLARLQTAREFNVDLPRIQHNKTGVRVMTVHQSKGLEFDTVFVPQLDARHWGKVKNKNFFYLPELKSLSVAEDENPLADERRLLFVAITRARTRVYVSFSNQSEDGKEMLPSPFLEEIDLKVEIEDSTYSKEYGASRAKEPQLDNDLIKYIEELFAKRGVTATGVNSYLKCPNKYLFKHVVRLPEPQSENAQFGTAIHTALQVFAEQQKRGEQVTTDDLISHFRQLTADFTLAQERIEELQERGDAALRGYVDTYETIATEHTETEKWIRTLLKEEETETLLSGKIDKIEHRDADKVIITDYKTGKVRSPNYIEGKTQGSDGDHKRQLAFYTLLLEQTGKTVQEAIIDFVEPNERGYYKRLPFTISETEKNDLLKTIAEITAFIQNGEFTSASCGEEGCQWCELAALAFGKNR